MKQQGQVRTGARRKATLNPLTFPTTQYTSTRFPRSGQPGNSVGHKSQRSRTRSRSEENLLHRESIPIPNRRELHVSSRATSRAVLSRQAPKHESPTLTLGNLSY